MKNFEKDFTKLCLAYIGRTLLRIFYLCPIKSNRVMFISMGGKQYSCNPRYVSEYLQKNYHGKYELIWTFRCPEKFSYLEDYGIVTCKFRSLKYYFYKLTSRISVTNYYWGPELPSRKGQLEIQTWHGGGGGTKKASGDDKALLDNWAHYKREMLDSKRYLLMMTSSETSMKNTVRGAMKFSGPVIGGTPRNDILLKKNNPEISEKVYKAFGLDINTHIMLYAPTWRRDSDEISVYNVNFSRVKAELIEKFGGEWRILVRLHPLASKEFLTELSDSVINATDYPDMQELLYTVDAVITDYSSFVWDYSFTYKPCFLYCTDLSLYKEERDFYTPIDTWGFDVCENNDQLVNAIKTFDEEIYREKLKKRQAYCGTFEDGHATTDLCNVIESVCYGDGKWQSKVSFKY